MNFTKHGSLKMENMSLIEADNSDNFGDVEAFLAKIGIKNVSMQSKKLLKYVSKLVSTRSAKLSAAAIAAVVQWMDHELKNKHTVGIDGSIFEKYPGFKDMMEEVLESLFKKNVSILY